jgi:hypothetical protein
MLQKEQVYKRAFVRYWNCAVGIPTYFRLGRLAVSVSVQRCRYASLLKNWKLVPEDLLICSRRSFKRGRRINSREVYLVAPLREAGYSFVVLWRESRSPDENESLHRILGAWSLLWESIALLHRHDLEGHLFPWGRLDFGMCINGHVVRKITRALSETTVILLAQSRSCA